MKNISVDMVRETLDEIPDYPLPEPYSIRWFEPGDAENWQRVQIESDHLINMAGMPHRDQFGSDVMVLKDRQCFLCDGEGDVIGTASAWFDDNYREQRYGRVHWVAIVRSMRGRGLSKPLMTAVCNRLASLGHERACLGTSTARIPAIHLYLKFDFVPDIQSSEQARAWDLVRQRLKHPALERRH